MATTRTPSEQIADLQANADVVVVLTDALKRAKQGEFRSVVIAAECVEPGHHATVYSTLEAPGHRARLIGLLHMALARLTCG